jgi:hypothetical protein
MPTFDGLNRRREMGRPFPKDQDHSAYTA